MDTIKFGTDGWRAIIADTYTFANLEKVARATGQWLLKSDTPKPTVVVGYDTRFHGHVFAERVAQVLGSLGIHVHLSDTFVTTPAVSWATVEGSHTAGVVVTASHNPPEYNGFKIKADFGGPATPQMISEVESELKKLDSGFKLKPIEELERDGVVERFDLRSAYIELLKEKIDIEAIKEAGTRIAYDAMYGAGQGILTELLGVSRVVGLHNEHNPGMNGRAPEPIARNLDELMETVRDEHLATGLATDGDADRIGMVDEQGVFVDSHKILALLVKYLHEEKELTGDIVKTFSTTDMLDRMGEYYNLEVETTPIGFKFIGPLMVARDVLVGGEESGGMAVKGHIPERDGLYIGLTIVEMMVKRERSLSGLVRELMDDFGPHYQSRSDLHTTNNRKTEFLKQLKDDGLKTVNRRKVNATETLDGFKFRVKGGWLMFRPSGTEPVLRIYSEASSQEEADALVQAGIALVEKA